MIVLRHRPIYVYTVAAAVPIVGGHDPRAAGSSTLCLDTFSSRPNK